jgi:hypothetical protein
MRIHWAVCAFVCVLIATLPANLSAQTIPASTPKQAALSAAELAPWGPYARLVGQSMKDVSPSGYRLRWRWETPGQVLLEEWYGGTVDSDKPAYVMTIRLGAQPGTLNLKSSTMMGKEWVGTLQSDGSISFVGKGLLKMPYSIRVDEQGAYVQADTRGHTYTYAPTANSAEPVVAEAAPATAPAPAPAYAPAPAPVPAPPVVAKQEPLPPAHRPSKRRESYPKPTLPVFG